MESGFFYISEAMRKLLIFAVLCCTTFSSAYGDAWMFQYELPNFTAYAYTSEDADENTQVFLAPLKVKRGFKLGDHNLSWNVGLSLFFEDGTPSSVNLSAGASWYGFGEPLSFFHCSLYPVYEFAAIPLKDLSLRVKGAFDIGFTLPLIVLPVFLTAYARPVCEYGSWLWAYEAGFSVGLGFIILEKEAKVEKDEVQS